MEEFIANTRMVLGTIGYSILEPLLKSKQTANSLASAEIKLADENRYSDLTFTVNNLTAHGAATDEGFVLKKGSQLSKTNTESIPGKLVKIRERLLKEGSLLEENGKLIANEDILFSSASYAAAIVAGTSRSGPQSWKDATSGRTMKQIEDSSFEETMESLKAEAIEVDALIGT
jgi:hypothetical protein